MTVKDLLYQCTADEVAEEIMFLEEADEEQCEEIRIIYKEFIARLKKLEPAGTDYVVIGVPFLENGTWKTDVCLYAKSELEEEFSVSAILENIENVETLSDEKVKELLKLHILPCSYGFEFSPWEEVLGYEVDKESLLEYGESYILALVLCEMTLFGFTREQVEREQEKIEETLAEVREARSASTEKAEERYLSAEKVFAKLGIQDDRILEEIKKKRDRQNRELLHSQIQNYLAVKKYMENRE